MKAYLGRKRVACCKQHLVSQYVTFVLYSGFIGQQVIKRIGHSVSDWLWAGGPVVWTPVGRSFPNPSTPVPRSIQPPVQWVPRLFPGGLSDRGVALTIHHLLWVQLYLCLPSVPPWHVTRHRYLFICKTQWDIINLHRYRIACKCAVIERVTPTYPSVALSLYRPELQSIQYNRMRNLVSTELERLFLGFSEMLQAVSESYRDIISDDKSLLLPFLFDIISGR